MVKLKQVDHIINENTLLANMNHPFIVKKIILYKKKQNFIFR